MTMITKAIQIGSLHIGVNCPPFIIAEISGNHNQSLDRAIQIIRAAAMCGVQAIKIQTYTPDTMTLNLSKNEFLISDPKSLWFGKTLYDLYSEAYTPWEWHEPIFREAKSLGLIAFSTPFDATAVDFLEKLDVPCYKIASFESTDLQLIKKVAQTGKPIIASTGMASEGEIRDLVNTAHEYGCNDLILLKCTSTYPALANNSNLNTIPYMRKLFGCNIGLSDHTLGAGVSIASIPLGSVVIEKHFTLSRSDGGPDSAFSAEPNEMADLVVGVNQAWQALGEVKFGPSKLEEPSLQYRRSLYITKDIKAGECLSPDNVRAIRPGYGLSTKYYDEIMGRVVKADMQMGTPITWDILK